MSNFDSLRTHNKLASTVVLAGAGAIALNLAACGQPTEASSESVVISCSGSQPYTVRSNETLTSIVREEVSDGTLDAAQTHNAVTGITGVWLETDSRNAPLSFPDSIVVDPSKLPAFNRGTLPMVQAEEVIAIPEVCTTLPQDFMNK